MAINIFNRGPQQDRTSGINADPGTPLWWLYMLELRLVQRAPEMLRMDDFYRGEHPLPFLTRSHDAKMRDQFRRLLEESRSNFMRLVIDTAAERLSVEGFRLSAETDPVSDKASWQIWQANQMDAQSQIAFQEALSKGVSYVSVWADDDKDGYPDIAIEDPLQCIVAYQGGSNYRQRAAALKVWLDEYTGERRANVYLPDGIYKFVGKEFPRTYTPTPAEQSRVSWVATEDGFVPNPLGVVPIIPLRNRPRLLVEGQSEIADVYRIQNQINGFNFLLALAGYFGAHKQRWAVGLTMFENDQQGKPQEPFDIAIDRLLHTENPDARFGEFSQTDLSGYLDAIDQKVRHIAQTSGTPRHYMDQQGQAPSGDAIKSAESSLIKKVEQKQRTFGEGLEEAIRLARRFAGEADVPVDSEIVWADPEQRSLGATTDAVVKQYVAGLVPKAVALERIGYSQTQIRQILASPPGDFADLNATLTASLEKRDLTGGTPAETQTA